MNLRTILHRPTRAAAVVAVAGLLFAACGTASGSEGADTRPAQPRQDTPVASAADADTLYHYLGTLTPDRARADHHRLEPERPWCARRHRRRQRGRRQHALTDSRLASLGSESGRAPRLLRDRPAHCPALGKTAEHGTVRSTGDR